MAHIQKNVATLEKAIFGSYIKHQGLKCFGPQLDREGVAISVLEKAKGEGKRRGSGRRGEGEEAAKEGGKGSIWFHHATFAHGRFAELAEGVHEMASWNHIAFGA